MHVSCFYIMECDNWELGDEEHFCLKNDCCCDLRHSSCIFIIWPHVDVCGILVIAPLCNFIFGNSLINKWSSRGGNYYLEDLPLLLLLHLTWIKITFCKIAVNYCISAASAGCSPFFKAINHCSTWKKTQQCSAAAKMSKRNAFKILLSTIL